MHYHIKFVLNDNKDGFEIFIENGVPAEPEFELPVCDLYLYTYEPGENPVFVINEITLILQGFQRRGHLNMTLNCSISLTNQMLQWPSPWNINSEPVRFPNTVWKTTTHDGTVGVASTQPVW